MALTKIPGSLIDTASGINGLIYPSSDGTAGQFLTTDGSGNLSFATVTTYTDSDVETYLDGGTSTPTFATATVSGTLTVVGDLDLTGDINSYNVTDLDITDQTITLGAGQTEALSGGSGIIVDGSEASILWDETNDSWDFNKSIHIPGTSTLSTEFKIGNLTWNQNTASTHGLLHQLRTSDGYSELQINNTATAGAVTLNIRNDSASVATIKNDGAAYFAGDVGIGTQNPDHKFHVDVGAPSSADKTLAAFSSERTLRDIGFVWDDSASTLGIATLTNHHMAFHTNGNSNERMRISSSGTVYTKSTSGIVTDGLVTHLEVLNADSYPGSGSTWYDLAGNNNASLINFSYNYKDHFDITNSGYTNMTNTAYGQSSCTVCVLMSTNDTQAVTFVGNNPNAYIGAWEDTGTQNFYHSNSGTVTYYINGEQTAAWSNRRSRARGKWMWVEMTNVDFTNSYWTTLNFNGYGGAYVMTNYNSVIGAILVYNKSLSDAERQQNFAYIRRTYGETPDWATQVIQPTLNSPYSNYGSSWLPMEYYKDTTGHVHITGLMYVASSTTAVPFTMPVGYRPRGTIMFDANSSSPGEGIMSWELTNAGNWTPRVTVNGWANIDAIYYPDGE